MLKTKSLKLNPTLKKSLRPVKIINYKILHRICAFFHGESLRATWKTESKRSKVDIFLSTAALMCTLLLMVAQNIVPAQAAQINWQDKEYNHYAQKEDIKNVLTDFFASQGIGVVCSENVKGKVSGNFKNKDPQAFFKHITDAYNLVWYYDGAAVYLYSSHEVTSSILNLEYLNMNKFRQNLIDLDIHDPRFAMRMIEKERIIYVSGPQRYVDLISQMATQLDAKAMTHGGMDDVVKIFQLKHAWADDKSILFRNNEMVIPGVATMLNNLIAGTTKPSQVVNRQPGKLLAPLSKLKGKGLRKYQPKNETVGAPNGDGGGTDERLSQESSAPLEHEQNQELPTPTAVSTGSVQADPRQNAVVVRDREEKMPYYAQIIDLLDAPVNLVEIRATIIDIDHNDFKDIGVQWEFFTSKDNGEKGYKGGLNTSALFSREEGQTMAQGLQLPTGNGLNLSTIIGDATEYFLAKVNALEEIGKAKILSRPSVLTLNNLEAQLEHSQTFYVPLTGEREVDLYDISAGVVLRVTPHIIEDNQRELVKLAIQIEDGELTNEKVKDIPVVTKSVINTQAVVGQKESLLIGGYKKERNENMRQGLPCLGNVPFFGWLFKKKTVYSKEHERIFLITPTIVPYGASNRANGSIEKTTETVASDKIKAHGLTSLKSKGTDTSAPLPYNHNLIID